MIDITIGSVEEKIIKAVQKDYPITVDDLGDRLRISRHKLRFELFKLQSRGIVELDLLPDKTYIRLVRSDIRFIGRQHQETFIKRRRQKHMPADEPRDDTMYR